MNERRPCRAGFWKRSLCLHTSKGRLLKMDTMQMRGHCEPSVTINLHKVAFPGYRAALAPIHEYRKRGLLHLNLEWSFAQHREIDVDRAKTCLLLQV